MANSSSSRAILKKMARVAEIAPTLQAALDDWANIHLQLNERYRGLE